MHPKPAPRGRGLCPRPLGAGFGCILNRIHLKSTPKTGHGSHIYTPEALLTNPEYLSLYISLSLSLSLSLSIFLFLSVSLSLSLSLSRSHPAFVHHIPELQSSIDVDVFERHQRAAPGLLRGTLIYCDVFKIKGCTKKPLSVKSFVMTCKGLFSKGRALSDKPSTFSNTNAFGLIFFKNSRVALIVAVSGCLCHLHRKRQSITR